MQKKRFILSPCGTSLLTNGWGHKERSLVFKNANRKRREDVCSEERTVLEDRIQSLKIALERATPQEVSKMSAELNGIVSFYDGDISLPRNDYHLLLATDTWLGEETARLVERWLNKANSRFVVEVYRHLDLQTEDLYSFQLSLSELIKRLDEQLNNFKMAGYEIIFNLTGGFKSIQGFLQTISNFYADQTIYIFESSSKLLKIPSLPVKLEFLDSFKQDIAIYRRIHLNLRVSKDEISKIKGIFILQVGDEVAFSPWGELMFAKAKEKIYAEMLLPPPKGSNIRYSKKFERDVDELPPDRKYLINKRVDQLIKRLKDCSYNPASLDFKSLKGNPLPPSTHEIDAWSDKDARRIFGHFEGKTFVLDSLGKGLH